MSPLPQGSHLSAAHAQKALKKTPPLAALPPPSSRWGQQRDPPRGALLACPGDPWGETTGARKAKTSESFGGVAPREGSSPATPAGERC
ncbi:hypothetical protein Y1Q_0019434 [Alligator mississippiensis]|uniref:Uncharacterized protein n=1 Tax=Alligator mississippiensis TaxID=8496 RepID=A0A151P5R8_ALLMI|nr:hypothetical protein Y1Q_0019434 [Alligator mississippiensis]